MHDLIRTKTFWLSLSAILTAVAGYATGELSAADAIQTGLIGAIGGTLRHGIARGG